MEISQLTLVRLWLYAFVLGAELGAVYDAIGVTRVFLGVSFTQKAESFFCKHTHVLLRPRKRLSQRPLWLKTVVFAEDFFFSIFSGISVILLFYSFNNGKIRIPVLLGLLIGFVLYRRFIGRHLVPLFEIIFVILQNICTYIIAFLIFPFRKIIRYSAEKLSFLYGKHVKNKERKQRIRFTMTERRRIDQDVCGMLEHKKE